MAKPLTNRDQIAKAFKDLRSAGFTARMGVDWGAAYQIKDNFDRGHTRGYIYYRDYSRYDCLGAGGELRRSITCMFGGDQQEILDVFFQNGVESTIIRNLNPGKIKITGFNNNILNFKSVDDLEKTYSID